MRPTLDYRPMTLAEAAARIGVNEYEFWEIEEALFYQGDPLTVLLGVGGFLFDPLDIETLAGMADEAEGRL